MKKLEPKYLVLFDHDGTLCHEDRFESESFEYAFEFATKRIGETNTADINIEKLREEVKGTSERNLIKHYCQLAKISFSKSIDFENNFYLGRAAWYKNMILSKEFIWSSYYPDSYSILNTLKNKPNYLCSLITGNPKNLIEFKIPTDILSYFTDSSGTLRGSFGNEGNSRQELLSNAIQIALKSWKGFKVLTDEMGFAKNIVYIADSKSDFFSGLETKIKTIWIPSRNRRDVEVVSNDLANSYIKSLLGSRCLITNNLISPEVYKMVGLKYE